jgi:hypothetical protein
MVCRGFRPNHQISRRTGVLNVRTCCKVGGPPLCQSVPRYRSSVVLTAIVGAGMPWLWQVVLLWTATLRKDRSLPNCRFPLWCAGTRDRLPRCNRLGRGRAARWNAAGRTAEAETSLPPALLWMWRVGIRLPSYARSGNAELVLGRATGPHGMRSRGHGQCLAG